MPVASRLPNGYPQQLKGAKQFIQNGMLKVEKQQLSMAGILDLLKKTFDITNYYTVGLGTRDEIFHIDMDTVYNEIPISFFIEVIKKSGKIKVGNTIVVWLDKNNSNGEEYWVDNYKW